MIKQILLLAILSLFTIASSAQEKKGHIPYDWEAATNFTDHTNEPLKALIEHKIMYYDPETKQHITKQSFKKKYGKETLRMFYDLSYLNILDVIRKQENRLYSKIELDDQNYRWRLNPVNVVVGGSMIGVSLATVLVCNMQNMNLNTIKIINYAGAGVALVGTIVLISGLHKEYVPGKGLAVSNNLYLDSPAGLSLAIAF